MKTGNYLLALGILLALPLVGHAQTVIYSDSFESGNTAGWTDTVMSPGGTGYAYATVPESYWAGSYGVFNGQAGSDFTLLNLQGNGTSPTVASNNFFNPNVGATYAANTTYVLTYVAAGSGDPGFGTLSTSFEAGGTVIGSTTSVAAQKNSIDAFATYTITFDTASNPGVVGQAIGIDTIYNNPALEYQRETAVDNYQITATPDTVSGLSTVGINLTGDLLWADAMRGARPVWNTFAAPYADPGTAPMDSNNWPTEDALMVVWEGHGYNDGHYALSFNGKATIADLSGYCTVLPGNTGTYNASTNTTTATLVVTDAGAENFELGFSNTQRTSSSGTNTGITNVHLYRPVSEGSTTSYVPGTLFTNQVLAIGEKFSTIRFMWLSAVLGSTMTNWSDRNPPTAWNQSNGDGQVQMAYEYMVAYCNATNTDLYLNIPMYATDTFVTNLAKLVKYGSDGTNPYSSVQTSPAYAPLNSNLHVYLEYSNELWNGGSGEEQQNYQIVVADQSANNAEWSILNYDGAAAANIYVGTWRRVGLRAVQISNDFRTVFGDSAMPPNANPTVRPLLEFQAENGQATGSTQLAFLSDYFNNADGVAHVTTPQPVNYFLWGGGGATYYGSNNDLASTLDAFFASGIPNTTNTAANNAYPGEVQTDATFVKAYGLKRVAYEGGWAPYNGTNLIENIAGSPAALAKWDPRAATAQESAQTIFQQSGGDLNIFFQSSDWDPNFIWGLTDNVFNLTTPLYQAVNSIGSTASAAVTFGNAISGTTATTLAYGSQLFALNTYWINLPNNGTLGWVPLIPTTGNYQISLNINNSTSGGKVRVLLDGKTIGGGVINVPVSGSPQNVVVATVNLAKGQHGLLLEGQYTSNNSYSGTSCTFTSVVLTPEP